MIFKKRYVRSEWMKGLLEAEQLIKDGYTLNKGGPDSSYIWFKNKDSDSFLVGLALESNIERCFGIWDYLTHYENNLKVEK